MTRNLYFRLEDHFVENKSSLCFYGGQSLSNYVQTVSSDQEPIRYPFGEFGQFIINFLKPFSWFGFHWKNGNAIN